MCYVANFTLAYVNYTVVHTEESSIADRCGFETDTFPLKYSSIVKAVAALWVVTYFNLMWSGSTAVNPVVLRLEMYVLWLEMYVLWLEMYVNLHTVWKLK